MRSLVFAVVGAAALGGGSASAQSAFTVETAVGSWSYSIRSSSWDAGIMDVERSGGGIQCRAYAAGQKNNPPAFALCKLEAGAVVFDTVNSKGTAVRITLMPSGGSYRFATGTYPMAGLKKL